MRAALLALQLFLGSAQYAHAAERPPLHVHHTHHARFVLRHGGHGVTHMRTSPRGYWVRVWTTGYDDIGTTASGLPSGYGRVAVDPRIFPFGTHFWIPGYGYAVAADTGGAVIGLHIDVWLATAWQCFAFTGYRSVWVQR